MNFDKYNKTNVPFVSRKLDVAANDAYRADIARINAEFKSDLLDDLGIAGHARANDLFRIAWDMGHSSGYSEVYNYAEELSVLLK